VDHVIEDVGHGGVEFEGRNRILPITVDKISGHGELR
jgi:hypothetical protein